MDNLHLMAKNAWYTQSAKATKGKGKNIRPAYQNFKEFFDWDAEMEQVFHPGKSVRKTEDMAEINRLMNEYLEKGGAEDGV